MPFYLFQWDDETIEHLAEHAVTPEEFEGVVADPERIEHSHSSGRPIAFGWAAGRLGACWHAFTN